MKADEILRKHEDANEMHFHQVDRKWIIEAMEEYAALRQPLVSGALPCHHNFIQKDTYWKSCTHCGMIAPLGQ